jgi:hypothetical protein
VPPVRTDFSEEGTASVPPKRQLLQAPYGIKSQKTTFFTYLSIIKIFPEILYMYVNTYCDS